MAVKFDCGDFALFQVGIEIIKCSSLIVNSLLAKEFNQSKPNLICVCFILFIHDIVGNIEEDA